MTEKRRPGDEGLIRPVEIPQEVIELIAKTMNIDEAMAVDLLVRMHKDAINGAAS